MARQPSPLVLADGWGHLDVEGCGRLRDAKLWPGGGREWDWGETGTSHVPGIQPSDVEELLEHRPQVVILSRGREQRLQVCDDTLALLDERGVEVGWHETSVAIRLYNQHARQGAPVAALLHSTC